MALPLDRIHTHQGSRSPTEMSPILIDDELMDILNTDIHVIFKYDMGYAATSEMLASAPNIDLTRSFIRTWQWVSRKANVDAQVIVPGHESDLAIAGSLLREASKKKTVSRGIGIRYVPYSYPMHLKWVYRGTS
jgi:hypothetical protein